MELQADFKELCELLNNRNVEYLVVGGFALAFHGVPRFTGDLDLYINPQRDNAERVLMALKDFGFGSLEISIEDLTKPGQVIQLGVPPVRIDFVTSIDGVTWQEAWAGRAQEACGNVTLFYLGRKQLVANKQACGRPRDLADIEALGEES